MSSEALENLGKISGGVMVGGGSAGVGSMNKAVVQQQPGPNPDTFGGLLHRFDVYLDQLAEVARRAGIHADLLSVETGPTCSDNLSGLAKDDSGSVIVRLQQRLDVLSHLIGSTAGHQSRAGKAF